MHNILSDKKFPLALCTVSNYLGGKYESVSGNQDLTFSDTLLKEFITDTFQFAQELYKMVLYYLPK